MSNNPCSQDLANSHATQQRKSAVPRLSIAETDNWFCIFLQKCQPTLLLLLIIHIITECEDNEDYLAEL